MKKICDKLQAILATDGPEALRQDEAARRHLEDCADCFTVLENLHELNLHLEGLPAIDAPDETVEALLAHPEIRGDAPLSSLEDAPASARASWWQRLLRRFERNGRPAPLAWGSAAAATLLIIVAFSVSLDRLAPGSVPETPERPRVIARYVPPPTKVQSEQAGDKTQQGPAAVPSIPEPLQEPELELLNESVPPAEKVFARKVKSVGEPADLRTEEGFVAGGEYRRSDADESSRLAGTDDFSFDDLYFANGRSVQWPESKEASSADPDSGYAQDSRDRDFKAVVSGVSNVDALGDENREAQAKDSESDRLRSLGHLGSGGDPDARAVAAARLFLEQRASLDGLSYRPARGYWSNTYVPGDPVMRLLQARLLEANGFRLDPSTEERLALHDAARRTIQPFDAPSDSALSVYLHADRRGAGEPRRMLVQVGLQATPRHAGRRPPMNVGAVLDLRDEIAADTAAGMRALIEALNESRQPGDRFRLFVAGRSGGLVVGPEDFRHGYLTVTLGRLLGDGEAIDGPTLGIEEALASAIREVAGVDDPDAPLGSSAVLLITSGSFGASTRALADMAHQSAVAGVPVSVVGIGSGVRREEIDRLTLAGQGNRRLLGSPAEAADLIDRELSAVSRAVARAVRLRIRLAEGVRLLDVVGSARLDEAGAQRVRDAERSVDLRLARSLGIEADRGEDEDGLQIVIPSFYAGDSHVVLLDVVADGPGPVAEVVARYKDLAQLRNGVSRASLALGSEEQAAGPLERNVLKNFLAIRLSETLERAGGVLAAGDRNEAARLVTAFQELLEGLRFEVPGLENDAETVADIAMLGEYRTLLESGALDRPERLAYVSDSLRYAARLKLLAPPAAR